MFLQVLLGKPLNFTRDEVLQGAPREVALSIGGTFSFALEKALRRQKFESVRRTGFQSLDGPAIVN